MRDKTRKYGPRNEDIRYNLVVTPSEDKVRENTTI